MTFLCGLFPRNHDGNKYEANSDFVCRGGILTMTRFNSPLITLLNASAMMRWCLPDMNPGHIFLTYSRKSALQEATLFLRSFSRSASKSFSFSILLRVFRFKLFDEGASVLWASKHFLRCYVYCVSIKDFLDLGF